MVDDVATAEAAEPLSITTIIARSKPNPKDRRRAKWDTRKEKE
jgi:hypothetical protein